MANFPRNVAMKSKYNNNYLCYVKEASEVQSFLKYSGDHNVLSPYTKYEIEQAKCDSSLIHIRCCYNNKYWVPKSPSENWIIAGAGNAEEDKTKWNCTLFQPVYDSTSQGFRFRNVYLGNYACLMRVAPPYGDCLIAQWSDPNTDLCDVSSIIDWTTLLSIPKYVALKGDNGKYLSARWIDDHESLQFASSDIGDYTVGMETFITKDGNIRFKSNYFGKFWRRVVAWIRADSTDTSANNPETLFWPIKVNDKNSFAFRNLGNNYFIMRKTVDDTENLLSAASLSIDSYSKLQLEELVLSRQIYNVNFRPLDARIYDQSVNVMATESASNSTQVPNTMNIKLSCTDTKSSTWNASVSMKIGVKTKIETGVPFIAEGKIEISAEFSGSYNWGGATTSSKTIETTYQVTVPPMTMVTVSLLATQGTSDVPYSYTQHDTLINGDTKTYQMDDGIYTGINNYNFTYETKSKPLT